MDNPDKYSHLPMHASNAPTPSPYSPIDYSSHNANDAGDYVSHHIHNNQTHTYNNMGTIAGGGPPPQFGKIETANTDSDDEDERYPPRERAAGAVGGLVKTKDKSRLCQRNSVLFLGLVLIQTAGVLAMISLLFVTALRSLTTDLHQAQETVTGNPKFEALTTYLALFCLAMLFEVYITVEALLQSNILQIGLIVPLQICMTVYSAFLPSQLKRALLDSGGTVDKVASIYPRIRIYAWVILGIIALVTVVQILFVWLLQSDFGWAIFYSLGASLEIKRAYTYYQVLLCLLKYDAFFWIGFTMQFLILVTDTPPLERYVTYVAIPVTVIVLVLSAMALRYENKPGMYAFLFVQLAGMLYFAYKIYRMFARTSEGRYSNTRATLIIFAGASIVLLLVTFVVSVICLRNFGKGLKDKIPPYWSRRARQVDEKGERMFME
ncbi:hypothetical protein T439DRAFT_327802 [Meredithblackwellia eburnea MCA 4105]